MAVNDIYELAVDQTIDDQSITNVHHFTQISVDGTGDPRIAVASIWTTAFQVAFLNCVVDALEIVQTRVRRVLPTQTQTLITSVGVSGAVIGDALPLNQVAVLREYGAPTGRKGVGNQRISGVQILFVNEGRINGSYRDILELYGLPFTVDQTHVASGFEFRGAVLGTDDVARKIERTVGTVRIKQLRSRTIGVGT